MHADTAESHSQNFVEVLVYLHDGCLVPASIAVIRSTEDSHHVHAVRPVVSLENDCQSRNFSEQAMFRAKSLLLQQNILPPGVSDSGQRSCGV